MTKYPLVSCLCVTGNRPKQLERVIRCFISQTYPAKELVVVTEDNNYDTITLVMSFSDKQINLITVDADKKLTLGQLRNLSIENASGDYFFQWDDDDWYHNDRIKIQLSNMIDLAKPASVMVTWLMFDTTSGTAYLSSPAFWPGSIMCKKEIVKNLEYPPVKKGEDTAFALQLLAQNHMAPILRPILYVYVFHGANTWDSTHFSKLFDQAQKLSPKFSSTIQSILDGRLSNDQASEALDSEEFLKELNHFNWVTAQPA